MSDQHDDGSGPAFPCMTSTGLSKRDWLVGQALSGHLHSGDSAADSVTFAEAIADEYLRRRKERHETH